MTDKTNRPAFATRVIHAGQEHDPTTGAVMQPIYQTSTYAQESPGVHKGFVYARGANPTRFAYERCIADLENGSRGFAFASGMAAIGTMLELMPAGSNVIAMDDVYGGTFRLFERVRRDSANMSFTYIDLTKPENLEAAITPETKMVWVETPTNPLLKIVDIEAVAKIAHKNGLLVGVDNTFRLPLLPATARFRRRHCYAFGDEISWRALGRDRRRSCGSTTKTSANGLRFCKTPLAVFRRRSIPSWRSVD